MSEVDIIAPVFLSFDLAQEFLIVREYTGLRIFPWSPG
jgi:hypothetical protein